MDCVAYDDIAPVDCFWLSLDFAGFRDLGAAAAVDRTWNAEAVRRIAHQ